MVAQEEPMNNRSDCDSLASNTTRCHPHYCYKRTSVTWQLVCPAYNSLLVQTVLRLLDLHEGIVDVSICCCLPKRMSLVRARSVSLVARSASFLNHQLLPVLNRG